MQKITLTVYKPTAFDLTMAEFQFLKGLVDNHRQACIRFVQHQYQLPLEMAVEVIDAVALKE